jgi:hypothetical protein
MEKQQLQWKRGKENAHGLETSTETVKGNVKFWQLKRLLKLAQGGRTCVRGPLKG